MQKHTVISMGKFYKGVTHDLKSPTRNGALTYEVGTVVVADGLDEEPGRECGKGINFCRTLAEALRWGPVVVELSVPARTKIIDTGGKLRAARVRVEARANLTYANLSYANLTHANLTDANLSHADLTGANLSYANLSYADLSDANLSHANLTDANLTYANLSYTNLTGAHLRSARYADLTGARGNSLTQLPSGWKVEKSGLIVRAK